MQKKKKIIIIEDQFHLAQGYAYNIAERLGLKFDIMNPRGSDGDIHLLLNHREADEWLHLHAHECAVILSDEHITDQSFTGSEWILDKLNKPSLRHIPMILMDRYINGKGAALTEAGLPADRIVSKLREDDVYTAVVNAYNQAKDAPSVGRSGSKEQAVLTL